MTRLSVPQTRFLVAFLFLTVVLRTSRVHSYGQTVKCLTWRYSAGEIITVTVYDDSWFCGSATGRYFALGDNLLFHLICTQGSRSPTQARVVMLNMNDQQTRHEFFNEEMMCDVQSPDGVSTGDAAYQIVNRLRGSYVPYDKSKCNSKHYVEYLAYGSTKGAKDNCPVFSVITAYTSVGRGFKLTGKNGQSFEWPAEGAMMQPTSKPPPKPKKRSPSPSGKSSWYSKLTSKSSKNSSSSSPQQGVRRSPRFLGTVKPVNRKGGGGGGHASGGGSHGGGEGEGGGEGGGRGGVNPAYVAGANGGANNRHHASSSATRASPLPFSFPKWKRKGSGSKS